MERFDASTAGELEQYPHFRVRVRPLVYYSDRFATLHEIAHTVRQCRVSRRGWDFPHTSSKDKPDIIYGPDYVHSESRFMDHLELWRMYKSGQFLFKAVIRELVMPADEAPRSISNASARARISIGNWIFNFTEITEFCYRLAQHLQLEDGLKLDIRMSGMASVGFGGWREEQIFVSGGVSLQNTIEFTKMLPSPLIVSSYDKDARDLFSELAAHLDTSLDEASIISIQGELLSYRIGGDTPREPTHDTTSRTVNPMVNSGGMEEQFSALIENDPELLAEASNYGADPRVNETGVELDGAGVVEDAVEAGRDFNGLSGVVWATVDFTMGDARGLAENFKTTFRGDLIQGQLANMEFGEWERVDADEEANV